MYADNSLCPPVTVVPVLASPSRWPHKLPLGGGDSIPDKACPRCELGLIYSLLSSSGKFSLAGEEANDVCPPFLVTELRHLVDPQPLGMHGYVCFYVGLLFRARLIDSPEQSQGIHQHRH